MNASKLMLIFCCTCFPFLAFSQTDTLLKKRNKDFKKIANTTKIELVYKSAMITEYSTTAAPRTFFVEYPYVRINGAKPVEIDKHANILRPYYTNCYQAEEQLDFMNKQIRLGRLQFGVGATVGVITAFSGVFAAASANENASRKFYTRAAIGTALLFTGGYLKFYHTRKANEHLHLSVDLYNSSCYKPSTDAAARSGINSPLSPSGKPIPSEKKYYRDTVLYELERNEPANSGLFGFTVIPVIADINQLNLNASGSLGIFYTYQSKFGISGSYRRALLEHITGDDPEKVPYGAEESYGIPTNYKKSTDIEVQTKVSLASREKPGKYRIGLGTTKIGGRYAMAQGLADGTSVQSITLRVGYQADNRVVQSDNGINFINSTKPLAYKAGNQTYMLTPDNILTSSTMMRSGIITAGIGLSDFGDIKLKINDDTYKGKREQRYQSDLYADVLYAHNIRMQDMTYYHALYPYGRESSHMPQQLDVSQTKMSKIGARIGYQALNLFGSSFIGSKTAFEIGVRPGPKTDKSLADNAYVQLLFGFALGGRMSN